MGGMSVMRPSAPKLATAAVIRALDGLDPDAKLAVLTLARRIVVRNTSQFSAGDARQIKLENGQVWTTTRGGTRTRQIKRITTRQVRFSTGNGESVETPSEFRVWVRRYAAGRFE